MKKIISVLLVGMMCVSLSACGGTKEATTEEATTEEATTEEATSEEVTVEELLEDAIEVTCAELTSARLENEAKADLKYEGKTVLITGIINRIELEGAYISEDGSWTDQYRIEFDKAVLAELEVGETIKAVGTMKNLCTFPAVTNPILVE